MIKIAIIRKLDNGQYRLYSKKKGPDGKRKNLGTYDSLSGAKQREKEVQYFKHNADDGMADDKETKAISKMSDMATFLEQAGMIDAADKIYVAMNAIDGSLEDDLIDPFSNHIDEQMNVGGPVGTSGSVGGGAPSMFSVQEAQRIASIAELLDKRGAFEISDELEKMIRDILAQQEKEKLEKEKEIDHRDELQIEYDDYDNYDKVEHEDVNDKNEVERGVIEIDMSCSDKFSYNMVRRLTKIADDLDQSGLYDEANAIDNMIFDAIKKLEDSKTKRDIKNEVSKIDKQNEDALARSNGLAGISVTDNQNAGSFQGFSDAYFYSSYGNLEGPYGGNN
jgi:hypothetical protein